MPSAGALSTNGFYACFRQILNAIECTYCILYWTQFSIMWCSYIASVGVALYFSPIHIKTQFSNSHSHIFMRNINIQQAIRVNIGCAVALSRYIKWTLEPHPCYMLMYIDWSCIGNKVKAFRLMILWNAPIANKCNVAYTHRRITHKGHNNLKTLNVMHSTICVIIMFQMCNVLWEHVNIMTEFIICWLHFNWNWMQRLCLIFCSVYTPIPLSISSWWAFWSHLKSELYE